MSWLEDVLCFPRIEVGEAPACMHSCVGRIRYLGVMLYDADKIEQVASSDEKDLIQNQIDMYLDPHDPEVIAAAKANGIADSTLRAAQNSPIYKFVKEWKIALPLHAEFRTLPNLFYVPPMLPVMAMVGEQKGDSPKLHSVAKNWDDKWLYDTSLDEIFGTIENMRFPLKYMANLFGAGNEDLLADKLKKLMAIRIYRIGSCPCKCQFNGR